MPQAATDKHEWACGGHHCVLVCPRSGWVPADGEGETDVSTAEPVFVSSLAHIPAPQAGNRCEQITREMVRDLQVSTYDDMVNYLQHAINEV